MFDEQSLDSYEENLEIIEFQYKKCKIATNNLIVKVCFFFFNYRLFYN